MAHDDPLPKQPPVGLGGPRAAKGSDPWQRAQAVAHNAAALGFDWPTLAGTLDKAREELDEVAAAQQVLLGAEGPEAQQAARAALVGECGDVLFSALNVCRLAGVAPSAAIEATTDKFERRFNVMRRLGLPPGGRASDLAHWQRLWQEAKRIEGEAPC